MKVEYSYKTTNLIRKNCHTFPDNVEIEMKTTSTNFQHFSFVFFNVKSIDKLN